jgi:hypothetical protein
MPCIARQHGIKGCGKANDTHTTPAGHVEETLIARRDDKRPALFTSHNRDACGNSIDKFLDLGRPVAHGASGRIRSLISRPTSDEHGRKRVPSPVTGRTALRSFFDHASPPILRRLKQPRGPGGYVINSKDLGCDQRPQRSTQSSRISVRYQKALANKNVAAKHCYVVPRGIFVLVTSLNTLRTTAVRDRRAVSLIVLAWCLLRTSASCRAAFSTAKASSALFQAGSFKSNRRYLSAPPIKEAVCYKAFGRLH